MIPASGNTGFTPCTCGATGCPAACEAIREGRHLKFVMWNPPKEPPFVNNRHERRKRKALTRSAPAQGGAG